MSAIRLFGALKHKSTEQCCIVLQALQLLYSLYDHAQTAGWLGLLTGASLVQTHAAEG